MKTCKKHREHKAKLQHLIYSIKHVVPCAIRGHPKSAEKHNGSAQQIRAEVAEIQAIFHEDFHNPMICKAFPLGDSHYCMIACFLSSENAYYSRFVFWEKRFAAHPFSAPFCRVRFRRQNSMFFPGLSFSKNINL
jgi:hypothetical protein